jgi:16S rRNA C967 or C1407 C5-methylase (RsmB/RsmF family)/NOL1/NOP2/fmu family ribosome biogenesis protein
MTSRFPEDFERRMKKSLPEDWKEFEAIHGTASPVSIRLNPKKQTAQTYLENVPWANGGKYLSSRPVFTLDPAFHGGAYYVQEASSMFLEQAILQHTENKGLRVLDLCAAPGGKSTHLLSLLNEDSLLVSNEVIRSRMNVLIENITKWGYPNAVVTNNDSADFNFLTGFFDVIVVDAPCSGEGLFRKDPDAMQEWSAQNVSLCSSRQKRILNDVWPCLKENGILIYSTCTYEPDENELNLKLFSKEHEVEFLPLKFPPAWGIETIEEEKVIGYRFFPHRVKGEGFFISLMQKKNFEREVTFRLKQETSFAKASSKTIAEVSPWFSSAPVSFIQRNETIQLLPEKYKEIIAFLSQRLRVHYAGTFVAIQKQNRLIPEHAAALSVLLNVDNFGSVNLERNHAIEYLRKDHLTIPLPEGKGFTLALYEDLALGWMNVLQGRINNLYPSEWRIKMKA